MKVGDRVRYTGPRLFTNSPPDEGVVYRMPVSGGKTAKEAKVAVQVGKQSQRLRYYSQSDLTVIG